MEHPTVEQQSARPAEQVLDGHPEEYYLFERYKKARNKRGLLALYYGLRPLMPRALQLWLRRLYARRQAKTTFPAWPIEPILVTKTNAALRERILQSGGNPVPLINYWPHGARAAVILTHDVEWEYGAKNIARVRAIERKYDVVSSWNFVPERYSFDKSIFRELQAEGCEIGVHGLYHDGRDFATREIFEERLPKMNAYIKGWKASGFRSPATHRHPDWIPMLAAEYDSSYPDTDPFEPQAGGCCSILPFFLKNGMVELPITMPQDHTLFEILRVKSIDLWKQKADWIIENHGLVNLIVHPDYMLTDKALGYYEEFLHYITARENLWFALPREVARWWRERAASHIVTHNGIAPHVEGPAADLATVVWASLHNDQVVFSAAPSAHIKQPKNGTT